MKFILPGTSLLLPRYHTLSDTDLTATYQEQIPGLRLNADLQIIQDLGLI